MNNVIDLIQKIKEKESTNKDDRYIELLEKAVSSLSYDEQLEFKKLYDERDAFFMDTMKKLHQEFIKIEKQYNKYVDDVNECLDELL